MKKTVPAFVESKDGKFVQNPQLQTVKCCFCGKEILEIMGNNPWPVNTIENARCCIECNWRVVIPARTAKIPAPESFEMPVFQEVK